MPEQANLKPVLTVGEVNELLAEVYPQLTEHYNFYEALDVFPGGCTVRLNADDRHLRPGGTVSGPSMFGLADVAIYLAILSRIGPVALAVTTGATIDFLRKPEAGADLLAETRLLKLGRRLAVGEALLFSEGQVAPVARASMTYSIPPGAAQGAAPV